MVLLSFPAFKLKNTIVYQSHAILFENCYTPLPSIIPPSFACPPSIPRALKPLPQVKLW